MVAQFLVGFVTFASLLLATNGLAAGTPSQTGLLLWVDASNPASVSADPAGRVSQWRDLSGKGNHLNADAGAGPELVAGGMNGKPVMRFAGGQALSVGKPIREQRGGGAILVVWQRSAQQVAGEEKWQRLISSRPDVSKHDNESPNFCLTGDIDGDAKACDAAIYDMELNDQSVGAVFVGRTAAGNWHYLRGDIAEVLIYDRAFLSEGELQVALGYLQKKWNARIQREENGWTRVGELGQKPSHQRHDLPLSDQENKGRWVLDKQLSDEFDSATLDLKRWHLNPTAPHDWTGREPALFDPANVTQTAGQLHLAFRKGDVPEMKKYKGYEGYTSALVQTNDLSGYGYYEIRAKPMNSAGSSSFWFHDTRLDNNKTEIDVFEIGGKAPGFERKYNMNAHVWKTPQEERHWAAGGVWNAPWNLAADYHIYGFEWNKEELLWYVDGILVRKAKNTNWQFPMRVIFDSEAMWSWFGKVNDADLPSTFSIDYLRIWRQEPK